MQDTSALIQTTKLINDQYLHLGLKIEWDSFLPGQFVMVKPPEDSTFLRRPFGIVKLENNTLELCIKIVGTGTKAIAEAKKGDLLHVLGPLGNGFSFSSDNHTPILIAGGYGIVPLVSLAHKLKEAGQKPILYYGAKTKKDLLLCHMLESSGIETKISTEDASKGSKGLITDLLESDLSSLSKPKFFAAGPLGLIKKISHIAVSNKIPGQISLDRYMACGMGVCLGCIVQMKDGSHKRACCDGPVFDIHEVDQGSL